jgi:bifunctional non-homologous end joining protein LigD
LASIEFAAYSTRVQPAVIKPAMRPRALPAGFIAPCLPTSAPQAPSGALWLHEIKHDGFREIARKAGERVKLLQPAGQ